METKKERELLKSVYRYRLWDEQIDQMSDEKVMSVMTLVIALGVRELLRRSEPLN